eukprot:s3090_g11.t1
MTPAERDHPNVLHLEEEVEGPPVPEMASPRGERDHDALEGGERLEPATTARGSSTTAMTSGSSRVTMEAVAPTAGATAKPRAKRANRKWPPYSPCLSGPRYHEVTTWLQDEHRAGRTVDVCFLQETRWKIEAEYTTDPAMTGDLT